MYKPTIGLEIHAELKTKTKMFCSCKNDPDEKRPNVNICPVCTAQPGSLPVPNKEAIKSILKIGIAIGGQTNELSEFDRKNYFYPDIPKAYQISQYKFPFIVGGELAGVQITRVHLEEDTARSSHSDAGHSLVDFNRAGVPLMELVTEPVIQSSEQAVKFAKELQLLLQYLGVAEANMEKGEIRFEANISVSDTDRLGTKVEVKNLNSFKALENAIEYEIERQAAVLGEGGKVVQETRGWNEGRQETYSQRSKEDSHDYRYFPDPDITKMKVGEVPGWSVDELKRELKETPGIKRQRLAAAYGLEAGHIDFYIYNPRYCDLFEEAAKLAEEKEYKIISNYLVNDIAGLGVHVAPQDLAKLARMIVENKVSSRGAKDIIAHMAQGESDPEKIASQYQLLQKSDEGELKTIVLQVISDNAKVVEEYRNGKVSALQFLVGQGMKLSKGSANPTLIREILEKELAN